MTKQLLTFLILALVPALAFSQGRRKKTDKTIKASTSLNFYPSIAPYSFFSSFSTSNEQLILNFLTATSGKFMIVEGEDFNVDRENINNFPSQLFGLGASIQIIGDKNVFQEISLTKMSSYKSSYQTNFTFIDPNGDLLTVPSGYKQRAFVFGARYEFGKYFGSRKKANLRVGLSGGFESSIFSSKRTPLTTREFPVKANIYTFEVSINPMLSAVVSKKVTVDFKIVPSFLVADFGTIRESNPTLPLAQQGGEREYNLPEINLGFNLIVRYTVKEAKRRKR